METGLDQFGRIWHPLSVLGQMAVTHVLSMREVWKDGKTLVLVDDQLRSAALDCLRSIGITRLRRYYGMFRPCVAASVLSPSGVCAPLWLFRWHQRAGSHVPSNRLEYARAISMPDAAPSVGRPRRSSSCRTQTRQF